MSLTTAQKQQQSIELKENFRILGYEPEVIQKALRLSKEELEITLNMGLNGLRLENPTTVWRLRDYMDEKIIAQGKTPVPYSVGSRNIYFPYIKDWE